MPHTCKERVQCTQTHATHNVYVPAHSQSPHACTPACSSQVLDRSCLIANCIITTFDYVIKTRVLVYVVQCINLWFTDMKQEENMVALLIRGMLMLSLVDSPVCPGSPC